MNKTQNFANVHEFKQWFEQHVELFGKPYILDLDQAKAVFDQHKNTLVTARAGSGKTRVIVAKVAYLVAQGLASLDEIAAFMFNRTAAAEVNQRIGAVKVDGIELKYWQGRTQEVKVASTFHKFALDIMKLTGEHPQLISETERDQIIRRSTYNLLAEQHHKLPPQQREEILRLVSSFIARAGQRYSGDHGLNELCQDVDKYVQAHLSDDRYQYNIFIHQLALSVYEDYLLALNYPKIDFNILMARATRLLSQDSSRPNPAQQHVRSLKYLFVDEYQDFSYLFFSIIRALRRVCPAAHLFAVGDDWQAINRFAGSDVDYFLNFAKYFPEDVIYIPLMTNYRSDRRIVENANKYMLKNYNRKAKKAIPFSNKRGKIKRQDLKKIRFNNNDLYEDALGDARFQLILAKCCGGSPGKYKDAARMLKLIVQIIKKHRKQEILLLHRHNFTSYLGVTLENLSQALREYLAQENIMSEADFQQRVRCMTMHKSKGLESDVVILLEVNRDIVLSNHPHSTIFELFGDTVTAAKSDQHRLLYVALTRAKHRLYILYNDKKCLA